MYIAAQCNATSCNRIIKIDACLSQGRLVSQIKTKGKQAYSAARQSKFPQCNNQRYPRLKNQDTTLQKGGSDPTSCKLPHGSRHHNLCTAGYETSGKSFRGVAYV